MNGTPAVSIIIPVYNAEKYLAETLESVLAQTFQDFEIILVDDGSTDGTSEIIDKFSDRAICLKNDHRGPASSRNLGLEAARGSLVAFLDADDLWLPTKLEKQVAVMRAQPQYGLITCDASMFCESGVIATSSKAQQPIATGYVLRQLLLSNWVGTSCAMVRRECFEKVGRFDHETFVWGEDWMMWLKIAAEYPVYFLDEPLVQYRVHAKSYSRVTADKHFQDLLYNLEKLEKEPSFASRLHLTREAKYRLCCRAAWEDMQHLRFPRARERFRQAINFKWHGLKAWLLLAVALLPPTILKRIKQALKTARILLTSRQRFA